MADYVEVEDAMRMPGLRVVLTPGIPGPWSESAKAVLHVKGLEYVKARQDILGDNPALRRWTGQTSAPVMAWNHEPPVTGWLEQLYLVERLAPQPRLIPADFDERLWMIGLANEILGDDGFVWHRRHIMVRDFTAPDKDPEIRATFAALGDKYWYGPEAVEAAPARCAEVLGHLAARLERQRARGSAYFIGDSLTAVDLYWACAAALVDPLLDGDCPMSPLFREVYTNTDPVVNAAAAPILMEHRDLIYRRYLELPVDL